MTRCNAFSVSLVAVVGGLFFGCDKHVSAGRGISAKAGIFYGGQIQNRTEWPLILDATRQSQGFRIEFAQSLARPARVHWEVYRLVSRQKRHAPSQDDSGNPATEVLVPAGSQRFDQVIPFSDADRPGDWKLKVTVDDVSVLDKTIHVVPKPATLDD